VRETSMRGSNVSAFAVAVFVVCGACVLGALLAILFIAKPTKRTPPDDRVAAVGGLQYEAMLGRPIHPSHAVDAPMVAGLPAGDRRPRPGQMLFGAFVAVANDSSGFLPAARRIELRDDAGRVYRPLPLSPSNPYAYVARPIPPRTRIPRFGTPADDDLAATGKLLLFRIPAADYDAGVLELLIHDARHPAQYADLVV
jgi:hypothetical protein